MHSATSPAVRAVKEMSWPARCRHCFHVHDAGKVEVVARYSDCSVWRCPKCKVQIDDRPESWGGSPTGPDVVRLVEVAERGGWL